MPEERLVDIKRAASILGCKPSTLRKWRVQGSGPPIVKVGSLARYDLKDLDAFIDANRVPPKVSTSLE